MRMEIKSGSLVTAANQEEFDKRIDNTIQFISNRQCEALKYINFPTKVLHKTNFNETTGNNDWPINYIQLAVSINIDGSFKRWGSDFFDIRFDLWKK